MAGLHVPLGDEASEEILHLVIDHSVMVDEFGTPRSFANNVDLEYQRIELLKFNLFDNSGTYEESLPSHNSPTKLAKIWPQFRLPQDHPYYVAVGGNGPQQCAGELVRFRTLTGICNDIMNPLMGSTDQSLARNVSFSSVSAAITCPTLVLWGMRDQSRLIVRADSSITARC